MYVPQTQQNVVYAQQQQQTQVVYAQPPLQQQRIAYDQYGRQIILPQQQQQVVYAQPQQMQYGQQQQVVYMQAQQAQPTVYYQQPKQPGQQQTVYRKQW